MSNEGDLWGPPSFSESQAHSAEHSVTESQHEHSDDGPRHAARHRGSARWERAGLSREGAGRRPSGLDARDRLAALRARPVLRGIGLGGRILLALLSVSVLVGGGYSWATYRTFVSNLTTVDLGPGPVHGAHKDIDGKDQNILMVGDDSREGATPQELRDLATEMNSGENTDTIMLLHVPADGKRASVISFPRDAWVNIPGFGMGKINSAFADGKQQGGDSGGAQLLSQVIYNMTGLTVDHFVKVSMLGFYRISIALQGVPVCLRDDRNDPWSGLVLSKGWHTIQGREAVAFVRERKDLLNGDFDRVVRQQYFLGAAFRKIESKNTLLNPTRLQSLLNAVSKSLEVDKGLAGQGLFTLATQMKGLTAGNLKFAQIPISGTPKIDPNTGLPVKEGGTDIDQVDDASMPDFIATMIGQPTSYQKAKPAAPTTVSVAVRNGSGQDGRAVANANALKAFGFTITGKPTNADPSSATRIEYAPGEEAQAKALAQYVPRAVLSVTKSVTGVTLVLGADGKQVRGLAQPTITPAPPPSYGGSHSVRTAAQADCIE